MKDLQDKVLYEIKKSLGDDLQEAYVTQAKKYEVSTELLSQKTKNSHQEILEAHVKKLNEVSAYLDTAERELADPNNSKLRSLKEDETYNLNASFLHAYYFENIGDQNSVINMDSIAFMRLERDFGSFDNWQKDFIACALSSRNGWAVTVYNFFLDRYMNVIVKFA
jgi:Fe-Mn family superoxide dismutase